jgi:hypothetical protein
MISWTWERSSGDPMEALGAARTSQLPTDGQAGRLPGYLRTSSGTLDGSSLGASGRIRRALLAG